MDLRILGLIWLVFGAFLVFHGYYGVKFQEMQLKRGRKLYGRSAVIRGWIHLVVGVISVCFGGGVLLRWLATKFF
jgi:hypothetical protein